MDVLNHLIVSLGASPWVYAAVFALVAIDGLCALVPGEAVLIAVVAVAAAAGSPNVALLAAAGFAGAFVGDNLAFALGRALGTRHGRRMPRGRLARAAAPVRERLERRPTTFILGARFVPLGRVALNYLAGATGLSRSRFARSSALAAFCWTVYAVLIASFTGSWFRDDPLLAAGSGIVLALGLGLVSEGVGRLRGRRRRLRAAAGRPTPERTPSARRGGATAMDARPGGEESAAPRRVTADAR